MKIALINPRVESYSSTLPPLGLLYIAAVLEKEGYDVQLYDPYPDDDSELKKVIEFQPDVIGLSILTTYIERAKHIINILRPKLQKSFFVAGGIHSTVLPEESLSILDVDCVVIGEGEITMKELLHNIKNHKPISEVNGLLYKAGNGVIRTLPRQLSENLDELPFPARHLINFERYLYPPGIIRGIWSERSTTMITSRGCPFQCIWCGSQAIFGRRMRRRSVQNVIDELKILINDYNIDTVWFIDDTFTLNKQWVYDFCDAVEKNNLKLKWGCQAHVTTADEQMFARMMQVGLIQLDFGVESGSNKVLKAIKKTSNEKAIINAFKIAKRAGIRTMATFMFGLPSEEKEDIEKTFNIAKKIKPNFTSSFFLTPFPGTELMDMAKTNNWITETNYFAGSLKGKPMMKINFNADELYKIRSRFQRMFLFRNYMSLFTNFNYLFKAFSIVLRYPGGLYSGFTSFLKSRVFDDFVFNFLIYYADKKQKDCRKTKSQNRDVVESCTDIAKGEKDLEI